VQYLGTGFYLYHADRDVKFKALFEDAAFQSYYRSAVDNETTNWISKILLCKYEAAHSHSLRKKRARKSTLMTSAKRDNGAEYSEANMGSGEARLYSMVMQIESMTPKSLVLLEEPETALHPSAQFEVGKYLVNVAERRNLQILLTTHSEYLMLALPQKSRIYLKREGTGITPIPGIGVRQAISMMDGLAVPSMYILVEDDVADAVVSELLRQRDPDFMKTTRVLVAGDTNRIQQMMSVFDEQKMPICAVRDGDKGADRRLKLYKLFGTEPPEKEIFKSATVRKRLADTHGVDWEAVDVVNKELEHHRWFDVLEQQMAQRRPQLLAIASRAYLEGVNEAERDALIQQIKASAP
jgi:predicted ATP-dependent endonuclease of OLD family